MCTTVALLDFNLQKHKLQMGVSVVVTDTKQVEEIRQREMDITKEKIQRILATGARVILTTKVLPMFDWFATLVFDWVS